MSDSRSLFESDGFSLRNRSSQSPGRTLERHAEGRHRLP